MYEAPDPVGCSGAELPLVAPPVGKPVPALDVSPFAVSHCHVHVTAPPTAIDAGEQLTFGFEVHSPVE